MQPRDLIEVRAEGLYCPPGDFFIDPVRPVARAVITHGHSDHARAGHGAVLATAPTLAIMAARLGEGFAGRSEALPFGEDQRVGDVRLTLMPAGHILGSAQVLLESRGLRIIVSGDYKRRPDRTCDAFEVRPADIFITEATFALPVFRHPPFETEIEKLIASRRLFPDRTHVVGAYSLGKAQRIIMGLRATGIDEPIYAHGAILNINAVYSAFGISLGELRPISGESGASLAGRFVIVPPTSLNQAVMRPMADPVPAFASGWMRIRARVRRQGVELPLVISDHADWDELTSTIKDVAPSEVWITHGREDAIMRWAEIEGIRARPLSLSGYDEEGGDAPDEMSALL